MVFINCSGGTSLKGTMIILCILSFLLFVLFRFSVVWKWKTKNYELSFRLHDYALHWEPLHSISSFLRARVRTRIRRRRVVDSQSAVTTGRNRRGERTQSRFPRRHTRKTTNVISSPNCTYTRTRWRKTHEEKREWNNTDVLSTSEIINEK